MQQEEEKLKAFTEVIQAEALAEAAAIRKELSKKRKQALKQAREHFSKEAQAYKDTRCSEITVRERRRVAAHMSRSHHKILQYREDCANEVFDMVQKLIEQFTASDEYAEHMKTLLIRAAKVLGSGFAAEVYLRTEDMHMALELSHIVKDVRLQFLEGKFALGGLQVLCPAVGIRVDLSFDAAIADLLGHFSEISGMVMD